MCEQINKRLTCLRIVENMQIEDSDDECGCDRCVYDWYCANCGMDMGKDDVFIHVGDAVYCFACFANRGCN